MGDDTGRETLTLGIRQACEGAWDGMGTETQTGSRIWSWRRQSCEVPWVRAPKCHSKCQISTPVKSEGSVGAGCGGEAARENEVLHCRSGDGGWSGLRRGASSPGSPHPRVLPLPGPARPGGLHLPGRPQTPHAERRARGIPRGGSESKPGLPQPRNARLPAAPGRRPRQPQEAPAQEAAARSRHVTYSQRPAVRMCSG